MPKKIKTFKSFKPQRESGHLYKELCANCKNPMGEHYGTGSSVMCPDQH